MALSVDKVFRFTQFVSNKESRGWVDPAEFNIAAELSQIMAYSKREAVFVTNKKILNDLRPFIKQSAALTPASGLVSYPADLRHFIGAWMDADYTEIQELNQGEIAAAMKSLICPPTTAYPAGVQRDTGFQLYPVATSADVRVEYLATPVAPYWDYTVVSSRPVYNSGGSTVHFGFDDILFLEIAMGIISNMGMNIKDETVTQYGMAFNKAA